MLQPVRGGASSGYLDISPWISMRSLPHSSPDQGCLHGLCSNMIQEINRPLLLHDHRPRHGFHHDFRWQGRLHTSDSSSLPSHFQFCLSLWCSIRSVSLSLPTLHYILTHYSGSHYGLATQWLSLWVSSCSVTIIRETVLDFSRVAQ